MQRCGELHWAKGFNLSRTKIEYIKFVIVVVEGKRVKT